MEVGIEDCLHIEFEYNKSRYHLRDTVVGKIYFLLVSCRLCQFPWLPTQSTHASEHVLNSTRLSTAWMALHRRVSCCTEDCSVMALSAVIRIRSAVLAHRCG